MKTATAVEGFGQTVDVVVIGTGAGGMAAAVAAAAQARPSMTAARGRSEK